MVGTAASRWSLRGRKVTLARRLALLATGALFATVSIASPAFAYSQVDNVAYSQAVCAQKLSLQLSSNYCGPPNVVAVYADGSCGDNQYCDYTCRRRDIVSRWNRNQQVWVPVKTVWSDSLTCSWSHMTIWDYDMTFRIAHPQQKYWTRTKVWVWFGSAVGWISQNRNLSFVYCPNRSYPIDRTLSGSRSC